MTLVHERSEIQHLVEIAAKRGTEVIRTRQGEMASYGTGIECLEALTMQGHIGGLISRSKLNSLLT